MSTAASIILAAESNSSVPTAALAIYGALFTGVGAIGSALFKYLMDRRKTEGKVAHSDAGDLWEEGRDLRRALMDENTRIADQRDKLVGSITEVVIPTLKKTNDSLQEINSVLISNATTISSQKVQMDVAIEERRAAQERLRVGQDGLRESMDKILEMLTTYMRKSHDESVSGDG